MNAELSRSRSRPALANAIGQADCKILTIEIKDNIAYVYL